MAATLEIWEFIYAGFALILGFALSAMVSADNRFYFTIGIAGRMLGSIFFGFIYLYYYKGGDTLAYYDTAVAVVNVFLEDPANGLKVWLSGYSQENYFLFDSDTGYPHIHIYADPNSYAVSQILMPILLVSFKSYLIASVLMSIIFFYGPWMLFKMAREIIVNDRWIAFVSVLLVPSVIFWGSGIAKDTITYSASCYFAYGFYALFIKREYTSLRIALMVLSVFLLLSIKPYIFLVLFPGTLIWALYERVEKIRNVWLRRSVLPVLVGLSLVMLSFIFSQLAGVLGEYSFDNILEKAIITQEDLKKDYYGGNNFDIGTIDPTVAGVLSKFPIATFYGLFSPTLLDTKNVVMLFSSLESTALMLLALRLIVVRPVSNFRRVISNPFLIFSLMYIVLFGFSIGLTTPNYGALVRFKIPLMPFFVLFLLILNFRKELKNF